MKVAAILLSLIASITIVQTQIPTNNYGKIFGQCSCFDLAIMCMCINLNSQVFLKYM